MMVGLQSIGLNESLLISVVGLGVVMAELFLLSLFVRLLAKVGHMVGKKEPAKATVPAPSAPMNETIEMAAALTASFAECGIVPRAGETLIINVGKVN